MSAPAEKNRPVPVSTMAFTPASALASAKAFSSPTRRAWPSALTGGLSMRMTATSPCLCVSTTATVALLLFPGTQAPEPCLARAYARGYSSRTKHSREDVRMLRGMMMDRPLLVSSVIDFAAEVYPDVQVVSQTVEGGIHRYGYAAGARAHRPAGERAGRARRQARRPGGDAGLERLPPLRALLRHRRHRRGLPHHQSAAVPRADHLHRQPRRGHGAVLRRDLPAAGGEGRARAQDHQDLRADDGPRAHAGQRPR